MAISKPELKKVNQITIYYYSFQVTERKQQLEKCLKLSRKMRKEMNALTEWLAATDMELTKRSAVEGMPSNLDSEVAWGKVKPMSLKVIFNICENTQQYDFIRNY